MAELDREEIQAHWKMAQEGLAMWRTETKESYDFAAGHQWESDVLATLEEEERPAITFDRIGVFVDAVSGMEINNRQMIKYLPVEQGDIRVNETLTNAVKYFENEAGAEDEDSEAVRDAVICGVGVTETVMNFNYNPQGTPSVVRRDPLSTWFDPIANRRNMSDGRFVFDGEWVSSEEALARWPDGNFSGTPPETTTRPHIADRAFLYQDSAQLDGSHEGQVFILQYQCWKAVPVYRMRDPQSGEIVDISEGKFEVAARLFEQQVGRRPVERKDYVRASKRVYYRAFLSGDEILEQDTLPLSQFTFQFITYKRDRNQRTWYGLVRGMKDPQRFANKWLSSTAHMLNTNAKGGAYVEVNAFVDPKKAEADWAKPNALMLMKEGAISGNKIMPRPQADFPAGMDKMMAFAFNSMPWVTGLNVEVLGLADREQAGVLETQRKQSAYSILAPLFAAVREYRKARGRLMLAFVQKFVPEGTLVRIVGDAGEQFVPLIKDNVSYDIKIDQAPDSPDYKQKVWEALGQILPPMMKAGYPVPPEVLMFSPLPSEVAEKWVSWIKEQGWMPPEHKQQMEEMQKELQRLGQEAMKLKEENFGLRIDSSTEMAKVNAKIHDAEQRSAVKVYQTQIQALNDRIQVATEQHKTMVMAAVEESNLIEQRRSNTVNEQIKAVEAIGKQLTALQQLAAATQETVEKKPKKLTVKRVKEGEYQIDLGETVH